MTQYIVRHINKLDFYKNYLLLLKQLTTIEPEKINKDMFDKFIDGLNEHHQIYVIENPENTLIIGSITVLIEPKIIHNMSNVCHIEDVVVDTTFRNKGLCKLLLNTAIDASKNHGCYKVILDCAHHNMPIYEKCGFRNNGHQMSMYL